MLPADCVLLCVCASGGVCMSTCVCLSGCAHSLRGLCRLACLCIRARSRVAAFAFGQHGICLWAWVPLHPCTHCVWIGEMTSLQETYVRVCLRVCACHSLWVPMGLRVWIPVPAYVHTCVRVFSIYAKTAGCGFPRSSPLDGSQGDVIS